MNPSNTPSALALRAAERLPSLVRDQELVDRVLLRVASPSVRRRSNIAQLALEAILHNDAILLLSCLHGMMAADAAESALAIEGADPVDHDDDCTWLASEAARITRFGADIPQTIGHVTPPVAPRVAA